MTIPEVVMRWGVTPERAREWWGDYNGIEKSLTPLEKAELEIKQTELRLKIDRQRLLEEKHLTVQRNRRDPLSGRLRSDWGE